MVHGVEMPSMFKSALSNTSYAGSALTAGVTTNRTPSSAVWDSNLVRRPTGWTHDTNYLDETERSEMADAPKKVEVDLRIVKIVIADVDKNIPVESRIIHNGTEQVTDLTDDELFFEVPIVDLLKKHNELRAKTLNKAETAKAGKDVFLEPIRIRDLRMVVVDIADFSN